MELFPRGHAAIITPSVFSPPFSIVPTNVSLLDAAKGIVDDCQNELIVSRYSHENRREGNEWLYNCYGFINSLLQKARADAYQAIVDFMNQPAPPVPPSIDGLPCPFHYAEFFKHLAQNDNPHWESVPTVDALEKGDILVYLPVDFQPQAIDRMPTARTGTHLMLIEEVTWRSAERLEVNVIDCTRARHCIEDSRRGGGIGRSPLAIEMKESNCNLVWGSRKKRWEKQLFCGRLKSS